MNSIPTFVQARDKFLKVLNGNRGDRTAIKGGDIQSLLNELEIRTPSIPGRFTDFVYRLRTLNLDHRIRNVTRLIPVNINSGSNNAVAPNTNSASFLTEGGYGALFINQAKTTIYKYIKLENLRDAENFVRELFLEAWIQTILGLDPEYGNQISKITGIYRSSSTVRTRDPNPVFELYITMNNIEFGYDKLLEHLAPNPDDKVQPEQLLPIWKQLAELLSSLKRKYNFYHRDLHAGNVMFQTVDGVIKPILIDFGMCCLNFYNSTGNKIYYGKYDIREIPDEVYGGINDPKDGDCFSYDILQYLTSIFQFRTRTTKLSEELLLFIYLCLCSKDGTVKLYNLLYDKTFSSPHASRAVFHHTYYFTLNRYSTDGVLMNALRSVPTINVEPFKVACSDYTAFISSRRIAIKSLKRDLGSNQHVIDFYSILNVLDTTTPPVVAPNLPPAPIVPIPPELINPFVGSSSITINSSNNPNPISPKSNSPKPNTPNNPIQIISTPKTPNIPSPKPNPNITPKPKPNNSNNSGKTRKNKNSKKNGSRKNVQAAINLTRNIIRNLNQTHNLMKPMI